MAMNKRETERMTQLSNEVDALRRKETSLNHELNWRLRYIELLEDELGNALMDAATDPDYCTQDWFDRKRKEAKDESR